MRVSGNIVSPFIIDRNWIDEMFVEMFRIFKDVALHGARYYDIIYQTMNKASGKYPKIKAKLEVCGPQMNDVFA